MEITVTDKGSKEVDQRVHELQDKWNQMSMLYKTGDKDKLKQEMDNIKSILPSMMFFGVMDMMMFSMMFSMMAIPMADYVSSENMPDTADAGADGGGMDDAGADGGGMDFDIGF